MPYVRLMMNQRTVSRETAADIIRWLPRAVAEALSVPESAKLTPEEITIDPVVMSGDADDVSRMECDVQLVVLSNFYPERDQIRDQIAEQINLGVARRLPIRLTCWTWVCLQQAGFSKSCGTNLVRSITGA
jgi:hypothetical protein